jgi:superoxide dismutase, Cu-Zn family
MEAKMRRTAWSLLLIASATAACASDPGEKTASSAAPDPWAGIHEAVAVVAPTKGNSVHGTVRFRDAPGVSVTVVVDLDGLSPNSTHAFHIHEFGDATSGDGKSAGDHYNPDGHPHAGPDAPMRHAGDLGNLDTDSKGHVHLERTFSNLSVAGAVNPVVGRSVIVHVRADDFTTQKPPGNAGDRIGCGVIGVAMPK